MTYLNIFRKGAYGIVRNVYHQRESCFLALKYLINDERESLGSIIEEIRRESFILEKIQDIKSEKLLKFYGLKKDTKLKNSLVLMMESGEATVGDLLKLNLKFTTQEVLYILKDLIDQMVILQEHGICNRDIRPDNFMIVEGRKNELSVKLSDFGASCIVKGGVKNFIYIKELIEFTPFYAAPEVIEITDKTFDKIYYNPFQADIFSLGKSLPFMLKDGENSKEIEEIIALMLIKEPESRITPSQLQKKLQLPQYSDNMKVPIELQQYIIKFRKNRDQKLTLQDKLKKHLDDLNLYIEINDHDAAQQIVDIIEKILIQKKMMSIKMKNY